MKKNQGLTLIELTIVLAVVSILSVIASLSVLNVDRRELQNMSLKLQADLRNAQRMAMIEGRTWKVSFHATGYVVSVRETNGLLKNVKTEELTSGIKFIWYSAPDMLYLPRGTGSGGFTVLIENGRFYQKLTATVSGGRIAVGKILSY